MNTVLSVSVIAVFAAVCGVLLQRSNREIALLFSLAVAVLIFLYVLPQVQTVTETVRGITENEKLTEILGVLIKALGVVLTGRIAVQLCKDAGENALAAGVDFAVKVSVLLLMLPLLQQFITLLQEILTI